MYERALCCELWWRICVHTFCVSLWRAGLEEVIQHSQDFFSGGARPRWMSILVHSIEPVVLSEANVRFRHPLIQATG